MELNFSIVIPVYNRPQEIDELLESLTMQTFKANYEVVIVEDGSSEKCNEIVKNYKNKLQIKYLFKPNTGAGLSRNFGMKNTSGNYFIILDSDVILPPTYLESVNAQLKEYYTDAFGGADAAHTSFSELQKAINYSMTSFLTTGGLRGSAKTRAKFQPRSFNMGISKKAFKATQGFTKRRVGEDIDLTFRLWNAGFTTQFIGDAFVYHKRRTNFKQFFKQTYSFGKERPILNKQYPNTAKLTYWFPTVFLFGILVSIVSLFFSISIPFYALLAYLAAIFIHATIKTKSIKIGFLSVLTSIVQFIGYGIGFLSSMLKKALK